MFDFLDRSTFPVVLAEELLLGNRCCCVLTLITRQWVCAHGAVAAASDGLLQYHLPDIDSRCPFIRGRKSSGLGRSRSVSSIAGTCSQGIYTILCLYSRFHVLA